MEGYGLNADIYINGVKCLFVIDEGNGGEFLYRNTYDDKNKDVVLKNVELLEKYIKTLPLFKVDDLEFPMDMDLFVDQILGEQEEQKMVKKFKKMEETAFLVGKPNSDRYVKHQFKRPLKDIPFELLKTKYRFILKNDCRDGVVILNTNLAELGLI